MQNVTGLDGATIACWIRLMRADDLSQIRLGFDSHRGPSAPRRGFSLLCGGALMVLLGLMGGCVTEHSVGTQISSEPDTALDKRGARARQYIILA